MTVEHGRFQGEIAAARDACRAIWRERDETRYTEHGLDHSERIISYFSRLAGPYGGWSEFEDAVFRVAAYIHDVGMQINQWGAWPSTVQEGPHEVAQSPALYQLLDRQYLAIDVFPVPSREVRRLHVRAGAALLRLEMDGYRTWRQPPTFIGPSKDAADILTHAWLVAFAHSDDEFLWRQFCAPSKVFAPRKRADAEGLRLRLLAGMLRFCDELDGNFRRVPDRELLWGADLDDHSRVHWLSCHLVESVEIEDSADSGFEVRLEWRQPLGCSSEHSRLIRDMIVAVRQSKIERTREAIDRMFVEAGEHGHVLRCRVVVPQEATGICPGSISPRIEVLLRHLPGFAQSAVVVDAVAYRLGEHLRPETELPDIDDVSEGRGEYEQVEIDTLEVVEAALGETEAAEAVVPLAVSAEPSPTLQQELRSWFYENRREGHWELRSGIHTDSLLHCRSLLSNSYLVGRIAEELVRRFAEQPLRAVVAVGTSPISLAVRLALRLNVGVTFALLRDDSTDAGSHQIPFETDPVVSASGNGGLLVLDDVIASGDTTRRVVDAIRAQADASGLLGLPLAHAAVLSLGTGFSPALARTELLCEIPEVYYASAPSTCRLCAAGIRIEREDEVRVDARH